MTTQTISAAPDTGRAPIAYVMKHSLTGQEEYLTCHPENVGIVLALAPVFGLTIDCRDAFAHAALRGKLPWGYGQFWTLDFAPQ